MSDTHAHSVAFVRDTAIPPATPPASQKGAIKWVRENLFSSWMNAILTIAALYAIYAIISGILPWLVNGVWTTPSLTACREVLQGKVGGCFSVLSERWNQLLFGFTYPDEQYWRPGLAFLLLFAAAAPVMFYKLPRKLLIITALYPFIAYYLIWGGTILTPILALVGLVAGYLAYARLVKSSFAAGFFAAIIAAALTWWIGFQLLNLLTFPGQVGWPWWVANALGLGAVITVYIAIKGKTQELVAVLLAVIVAVIWWALITPILGARLFIFFLDGDAATTAIQSVGRDFSSFMALEVVPSRDMGGFMLNMILGVTCVSLSIPLGILLALGRQSKLPLIKGVSVVFIEFIRGVPLITLLFVANVVLAYFLPPGTNFDLILRVIIMITMFSSAYIAEVIRGALAALPKGQYEAGDSLGLDYPQAMRLIILPQALKISIPGIVNIAVGLFKDTTLVSIISMFDLVGMVRGPILASAEWNGVYWELFGFAALLFFVVCYGISQYSQWLERQLSTERR